MSIFSIFVIDSYGKNKKLNFVSVIIRVINKDSFED